MASRRNNEVATFANVPNGRRGLRGIHVQSLVVAVSAIAIEFAPSRMATNLPDTICFAATATRPKAKTATRTSVPNSALGRIGRNAP